jgi:transketolase
MPEVSEHQLRPGSWHLLTLADQAPGFKSLSGALCELADAGRPVVVGTADLKYSNGLVAFERAHPDKFIQFGISEQNMVSVAAGLAADGMLPYVATFASFLALLACEQVRTDVAYTGLPVRLIGHHAGITLGFYGTSHHATEDLAILRSMAGMVVVAPADHVQLHAAILATVDHPGPIYFRIGRGRDPQVYEDCRDWTLGKAVWHREGHDVAIIATGSCVHPSLEAAEQLEREGISTAVIDMHTIKPIDEDSVLRAARAAQLVMTVEEHNVIGGLGGAVAEVLTRHGAACRLHRHGIPDEYSPVGPPLHLYRHYGLDGQGVAREARSALGLSDS